MELNTKRKSDGSVLNHALGEENWWKLSIPALTTAERTAEPSAVGSVKPQETRSRLHDHCPLHDSGMEITVIGMDTRPLEQVLKLIAGPEERQSARKLCPAT